MSYEERPDRALDMTQAHNNFLYPSVLVNVQENYSGQYESVYIYNISRMEFNTPRPPNHPHMLIRACKPGEPYIVAETLTHPYPQKGYDQNGSMTVTLENGYREATRMLCPVNPGIDQKFDVSDDFIQGGNLNNYGCFWSTNNPPTKEEIEYFTARMEKTFRKEMETMDALESRSPDEARARANNISHAAADWFGESRTWHNTSFKAKKTDAGKIDCGVCGEKIQAVAKLCIHCGAPTDEVKQAAWLEAKIEVKRGPGRPPNA